MKKITFMFLIIFMLISISYASARNNLESSYESIEKTHTDDNKNENDNADKDEDNSKNNIDDNFTPDELDDKDRTN